MSESKDITPSPEDWKEFNESMEKSIAKRDTAKNLTYPITNMIYSLVQKNDKDGLDILIEEVQKSLNRGLAYAANAKNEELALILIRAHASTGNETMEFDTMHWLGGVRQKKTLREKEYELSHRKYLDEVYRENTPEA